MFDHYVRAAGALEVLLAKSPAGEQNFRRKVVLMQRASRARHSEFNAATRATLEQLLEEAMDKFHKASFIHEHTWALSHADQDRLFEVLQRGGKEISCTPETEQMVQLYFECFLMEARSFLAFYMNYLIYLLSAGQVFERFGLELGEFKRHLLQLKEEGIPDAAHVESYFLAKVMDLYSSGPQPMNPLWGDLLKSLRDKITHFKLLKFGRESTRMLGPNNEVRFDWPTIRGETVDHFGQSIENGMFALVEDLSKHLYRLPWRAGKYQPDLWNDMG